MLTKRPTLDPAIREMRSLIRRHQLSYDQIRHVIQQARKAENVKPVKKGRRLPKLLTTDELTQFFAEVERGNLRDVVLLRLMFMTACRISELVGIKLDDIDLKECKIFVNGKGDRDRYILFDDSFRLTLRAYIETLPDGSIHLFNSQQGRPITDRRVRQIMEFYGKKASIQKRVHPHLMRHQMLTHLTREGVADSAIMLISGHQSKQALEVYQHLALSDVQEDFQDAVKKSLTRAKNKHGIED